MKFVPLLCLFAVLVLPARASEPYREYDTLEKYEPIYTQIEMDFFSSCRKTFNKNAQKKEPNTRGAKCVMADERQ